MKRINLLSPALLIGAFCLALPIYCHAQKNSAELSPGRIRLQLPPVIYAVPGVESNLYFDNLILTPNPANYVFDVDCAKGRNDAKRWRFTPKPEDVGSHDWSIRISDEKGVVAEGKTRLVVSPADAGKGKKIAVLVVGDSLTAATVYPARILELFKKPDNPELAMLGTSGRGGKPGEDGVAHEGYGGWAWSTFLTKKEPTPAKEGQKAQIYYRASPFLVAGDGKFDFDAYLKKNCNGRKPEFITIQLGVNDIFGATDESVARQSKAILEQADKLIAEFRKGAPDAVIGVGFVTPGAATQDAFGNNYTCGQTRWQYKKNQHYLNEEMLKKFADYPDKKVFPVPTGYAIDCENNFPTRSETVNQENLTKIVRQSNGVHPAPAGYRQMGDVFYCWMKSILNTSK